jgi:ubiquinone/menaquinone biosynthesis C-methylase UbiE
MEIKKINLGCGPDYIVGYLGLDREKWNEHVDIICDLDKGILPFKDNSIDEILCKHTLEHLLHPDRIITECYRSLKKGGLFHIVVPYAHHPNSFVPVHRNYWGINSKILFDGGYHEFGKWDKVEWDCNFANSKGLKQKILKPFIKRYPSVYEGHFTAIMPIADLHFKLIK